MKVGIITFHRAYNYGAVLQCYALQEAIRAKGHEVEIIDYRQSYIEDKYCPEVRWEKVWSLFIGFHFGGINHYLQQQKILATRSKFFTQFSSKFLNLSNPFSGKEIPQNYNRYVIGSDQMWGLHCTGGYDSVYWGDFERPKDSKLYGYAISANLNYHDSLKNDEIKAAVARFDGLSFREERVREDIQITTGYKAEVCIDPTLLTDASIWQPMINLSWSKKRYVALYLLRCKKEAGNAILSKAKHYANEHGCEVIDMTSMRYSVEDFVSIIKYAQCVFTTSFHATVFSVIFNRPFYSFKLNDGSDVRYENLLNQLHLSAHLLEWDSPVSPLIKEEETIIKERLNQFRASSICFLNKVLQ